MEHLVGQTLAERLKKGPLPLEQSREVATQIADALAAVHKQGIVHRDLKPGNVMLTKTGARLLDFGLARLTRHGEQPVVQDDTSAPTEHAPLTGKGTVLGTLPYMAPEQVEGRPADERTDLWALGLILYEMLTGSRAFEASTPTRLVAAILEREPVPLAERQPLTPPSLEQRARPRRMTLALVAVSLAAFVAGALAERWWLGPRPDTSASPVVRSEIDLTPERALSARVPGDPAHTQLASVDRSVPGLLSGSLTPCARRLALSPEGAWPPRRIGVRTGPNWWPAGPSHEVSTSTSGCFPPRVERKRHVSPKEPARTGRRPGAPMVAPWCSSEGTGGTPTSTCTTSTRVRLSRVASPPVHVESGVRWDESHAQLRPASHGLTVRSRPVGDDGPSTAHHPPQPRPQLVRRAGATRPHRALSCLRSPFGLAPEADQLGARRVEAMPLNSGRTE